MANSPVLMKILPVCVIMLTRLVLDQPTGMIAVAYTHLTLPPLFRDYSHPSAVSSRLQYLQYRDLATYTSTIHK